MEWFQKMVFDWVNEEFITLLKNEFYDEATHKWVIDLNAEEHQETVDNYLMEAILRVYLKHRNPNSGMVEIKKVKRTTSHRWQQPERSTMLEEFEWFNELEPFQQLVMDWITDEFLTLMYNELSNEATCNWFEDLSEEEQQKHLKEYLLEAVFRMYQKHRNPNSDTVVIRTFKK